MSVTAPFDVVGGGVVMGVVGAVLIGIVGDVGVSVGVVLFEAD